MELWCDPLTGLVAYPSFAEHLTECMSELGPLGLHLAIGDVDDLKEYVSERREGDPTMFGHLAGNMCMKIVGETTLGWADRSTAEWDFVLSGTFGGDEVIVAAAGTDRETFVEAVRELAASISAAAPRTCSFAVGSVSPLEISPAQRSMAYRQLVSQVDAALFRHKAELRLRDLKPRGALVDTGTLDLMLPDDSESPLYAAAVMRPRGQEDER